jgi:signal transduction histidine kinase
VVSLSALRRRLADGAPPGRGDEDSVRRQWWAALATLQDDLLAPTGKVGEGLRGVWLATPLPALYEPVLLGRLRGWVWAPAAIDQLLPPVAPLLPGGRAGSSRGGRDLAEGFQRLPLRPEDGTDPLLLLVTERLQVALAVDGPPEARRLLVRFDAPVLSAALTLLDQRLRVDDASAAARLRRSLRDLGTLHNDPSLALQFWPLLAQRLAAMAPSVTLQTVAPNPGRYRGQNRQGQDDDRRDPGGRDRVERQENGDLALLEALTHEVRTPLATIRTLIRSLLRRGDLPAVVRQRLEQIDGECSEQIDRFGLIFLAAELQRRGGGRPPATGDLARTDLAQLLRQLEDLWRRQLGRRGLAFHLAIAPDLPPVLSDPTRLETMLGGLMDRFSRGLPNGSQVLLSLRPAGPRLKLRLSSKAAGSEGDGISESGVEGAAGATRSERVGPVLSWNPDTGSLQLSRQATRQLFHQLGGRLTERRGTSLTVFFPLAERSG